MRLIVKLEKDPTLLSTPKKVILKKKSAAVETSNPVQCILGPRNSSKQNDIHLVCIFLLYSEPGSIAPAEKDDLQSCCP